MISKKQLKDFSSWGSAGGSVRKGDSQHLINITIWRNESFPGLLVVTDINRERNKLGNANKDGAFESCWGRDLAKSMLSFGTPSWISDDGFSESFLTRP